MTVEYFVENILLDKQGYNEITVRMAEDVELHYDNLTNEQKNREIANIYFGSIVRADYRIEKNITIWVY